ncbi:MAG: GNAT family N-acetyltransferase [Bdellovibrionota bacterium]
MKIRLFPIDQSGKIIEGQLPQTFATVDVCKMTVEHYKKSGFEAPWVSYLVCDEEKWIGTCAFKSAPKDNRVEIAYYTFPEFEGLGIATQMATRLVKLARNTKPGVVVFAQTLPSENSSTGILTKMGFKNIGSKMHPEDGEVWEWELAR